MSEAHKPVGAIFDAAIELPPEGRAAYLREACAGDDALRNRVEALLRAHESAGTFMDGPAAHPKLQTVAVMPVEQLGDRIGRYKLLQQIGEGGCGVVYMAEQEEPVRRRVALKVIKLGMDTKSVIARFEAERQALALMDHPNIAKVLDAGATETGRPYFVMELVRGIKITDYCDENNLSTVARLELFVLVCQAIQHAHQKGIIHRDIKPSNILVADHDGVPVPKVIDFGIAKATTDQRLTDKTLFTAFEQFIGTPAYMSPEQAKMSGLDIDTRSDIYSLGVLLYELLTARTPFEAKRLLEAGLDEIRRIIREEEPVRPSTRLQTLDAAEQTTVARHRQCEPPKLFGIIRGDLDWIVMKALEKDRTRRYETANSLAADIQRHLSNEPVNARPPSGMYRLQKSIRRNKGVFAAAAIIAAVLVVGVVMSTLEAIRATRAEREQSRLRQVAESKEKKSEQVAQFLKDMLDGVGPSVALGRDTTMLKEILDKTAKQVGTDLAKQPEVEAELRYTLGEVYWELGDLERAEAMHRAALSIRTNVFGNEDPQIAQSMTRLGHVLWRRGRLDEAEKMARAALAMQRTLFGNTNLAVARSLQDLAAILNTRNNLKEAEAVIREALATKEALLGHDNLEVADTMDDLAAILSRLGKGVSPSPEAAAIRKKLLGADNPLVIMASLDLQARKLEKEGKLGEAEITLNEYLAAQRKIFGKQHPSLAQTLNRLASLLKKEGKLAEAESTRREALAMQRNVLGEENVEVAQTLSNLADILTYENKLSEAEDTHRSALLMRRKVYGNDNINVTYSLVNLGQVLEKEGKLEEVRSLYLEAANGTNAAATRAQLELAAMYQDGRGVPRDLGEAANWYRKAGGQGKLVQPAALRGLAEILRAQGKPQEAKKLYEDEIVQARKNLGESHPDVGNLLRDYGYFLLYQDGQPGAAAEQYLKALAIYRAHTNDEPLTWTLRELGDAVLKMGKPKDAEPYLRQSLGLYRKSHQLEDRYGTAMPAKYLADALYQQHRLAEAEAAYRDALAAGAKCLALDSYDYASVVQSLLNVLKEENKLAEGEALCREILAQQRAAFTNDNPAVTQTLSSLVNSLVAQGKHTEAAATAREAAQGCHIATAQYEKLASDHDRNHECWSFAISYEAIAELLNELGQFQDAEKAYRDAQVLWQKLAANFDTEDHRFHLAVNYDALGHVLRETGRAAESLASYQAAQAIWVKLVADFNMEDRRVHLGWTDEDIGQLLKEAGRFDEAAEVYRQALAVWKKLISEFDKQDYRDHLSGTLVNLATALQSAGKRTESAQFLREAAEHADAQTLNGLAWSLATGPEPKLRDGTNAVVLAEKAVAATQRKNISYLDTLATAYAETGQFAKAISIQQEAIALSQSGQDKEGLEVLKSRLALYGNNLPYHDDGELAQSAMTRLREGKFAEAEALARECLSLREMQIPDNWRTFNARSMLGGSLLGQKKYAEAEPLLLSGYEGMKQREASIPPEGKPRLGEVLQRLVQLYEATARPDRAAEWKKKLAESEHTAGGK